MQGFGPLDVLQPAAALNCEPMRDVNQTGILWEYRQFDRRRKICGSIGIQRVDRLCLLPKIILAKKYWAVLNKLRMIKVIRNGNILS